MDNLKIRKIVIKSDFAHFKIPYSTKIQRSYKIPPISTVVGILKVLFNENVDNFTIGYTFKANDNMFRDIQSIYKEVNFNSNYKDKNRYDKSGNWVTDVCEIDYLVNPTLTIYTDIKDKIYINECLNMGKTDCLARVYSDSQIELNSIPGIGYDQWTNLNTGEGIIQRITSETAYNPKKGIYDIYTSLVRFNEKFEYNNFFDMEDEESIFLWNWRKEGKIDALNQETDCL